MNTQERCTGDFIVENSVITGTVSTIFSLNGLIFASFAIELGSCVVILNDLEGARTEM